MPTDDLLERLRAPGRPRPAVDPGLAGGLRAWLEDGVAPYVRATLRSAVRATRPLVVGRGEDSPRVVVARTLFRLAVTGAASPHAFEDALGALSVDEPGAVVADALRAWSPARRAALRREAATFASEIAGRWRTPPAGWLPRVGERLCVPLGGGQVLLRATCDLALGGPAGKTASVCMVEVRLGASDLSGREGGRESGRDGERDGERDGKRDGERDLRGRRFLALAETLRSGAAPCRVATYRPDTGDLDCDDVTDGLLAAAVDDVLSAMSESAAFPEAMAG